MNRYILFFFLILSTLTTLRAQQSRLVEVGNGYSQTSVNTTVFRNNSLVTQGDEQYISYYDGDGYLVLGKRKLDSDQWTLKRTQYKGNVKDAHNIISMMLDGEGYLHLSFDHHGHKLNYCRSTAPYTLELGDKEPMTGVLSVEWGRFAVCLSLRLFRTGESGDESLFCKGEEVESCTRCADRW